MVKCVGDFNLNKYRFYTYKMGEFMKILSAVFPKDVIHYHIQPYLMISAKQVKYRYYAVLKELRIELKLRRLDETQKRRDEIDRKRREKWRRAEHLDQIKWHNGWGRCIKCNVLKHIGYKTPDHGVMCRDCKKSKLMIVNCKQRDAGDVIEFTQLVVDKDTRLVYEARSLIVDKATGEVRRVYEIGGMC